MEDTVQDVAYSSVMNNENMQCISVYPLSLATLVLPKPDMHLVRTDYVHRKMYTSTKTVSSATTLGHWWLATSRSQSLVAVRFFDMAKAQNAKPLLR